MTKAAMLIPNKLLEIQFSISFKYHQLGAHNKGESNFSIEIINAPLLSLINTAFFGSRIYELMTITRPGDCLHYLQVKVCDLDSEVTEHVKKKLRDESWLFNTRLPLKLVSFADFDACFIKAEDNDLYEENWRDLIDGHNSDAWNVQLNNIFSEVLTAQNALKATDDFMIQHEIKLIEAHQHCNDRLAYVPRINDFDANLLSYKPENQELYTFLEALIAKQEIKSVSCPFNDFYLWRILVKEQVRRSINLQLAPQQALYLSGEDIGFNDATSPANWGGNVHTPFESMACADCVFLPTWRKFFDEYAGDTGCLAKATRLDCEYLFSTRDLGELSCADRKIVGDWFFYQQKKR